MTSPFEGIPVIVDPFVPKGQVFILNGSQIVVAQMHWINRRRFWYKPWTWLRKNERIDWWRSQ